MLKLVLKIILYLAHALWAIPVLIVIRVVRPLLIVRVGIFNYARVGHFVADVARHKAQSLVEGSRIKLDFWYLPDDHECSNSYWAQITRRWFRVHSSVRYLFFWNRILPFGHLHSLSSGGEHNSRDLDGYFQRAKLSLPITGSEDAAAREWMHQFGWKEGDPFVCLLVRDSEYLREQFPQNNWSYHTYRDSDIKTYVRAIDYLTTQGIYVFRMGKLMNSPVPFASPKFVDYAFRKDRSDFLDVWLFANCSLCISTGSGPDAISGVFRRPFLFVNFLPLQHLWSWSDAMFFPKMLRWKSSGRFLSMRDYLSHGYLHTSEYSLAGVEIQDLAEDQLLEVVKEYMECREDQAKTDSSKEELRDRYLEILMSHLDSKRLHGFIHPQVRLAPSFLKVAGEQFLE